MSHQLRRLMVLGVVTLATVWFPGQVAGQERPFSLFPVNPTGSFFAYLPVLLSPEQLLPSPEATLRITPNDHINASTYTNSSFTLINHPTHTQQITQVRINLATAAFPDMVFDPAGLAGDQVAKDFTVNSGGVETGYLNRDFAGLHDDGYDELIIYFSHFDPGEQFSFSIDVDPTSIRGVAAPGPHESGSVCGLELMGATVTITFSEGQVLSGQTYYAPGNNGEPCGSEVLVRDGVSLAPGVTMLNVPAPPAVVTDPYQTLRVTGQPWRQVLVAVVEGGLFRDGLPGGGFDIDPFEANSALWVAEYSGVITASGFVDIPITLFNTDPDAGLNHIVAIQVNTFGLKGATSQPIVVQLQNP